MNGQMPYFKCYASQWLGRLATLPREAQLLVFKAALVAWDETRSGSATRSVAEWAKECSCGEVDILVGAAALESRQWCRIASEGTRITVCIPEMDEQAEYIEMERAAWRERQRKHRAKYGLGDPSRMSRGTSRTELASKSKLGAPALASSEPAGVNAEDRHKMLGPSIARLGKRG